MSAINFDTGKWTTKDGKTLFISEMTTSHLENAIDFLNSKIIDYINRMMSQNEDYEVPDYVVDKLYELATELENRRK